MARMMIPAKATTDPNTSLDVMDPPIRQSGMGWNVSTSQSRQ
jgi:hypothetical protein